MSDGEPMTKYLVDPSVERRLNVWLRSQGLVPVRADEPDDHGPRTYTVRPARYPGDADVSVWEASRLVFVAMNTMQRWVEVGHAQSHQATRIRLLEVERLLEEHGGPPKPPRRAS